MPVKKELRTSIMNLDAQTEINLQLEPEIINGNVAAQYNIVPSIGSPSNSMDFSHTTNESISLKLRWDRLLLSDEIYKERGEFGVDFVIDRQRAFIRSLVNPTYVLPGVIGGTTPLCRIKIPGVLEMLCRFESIDWEVTKRSPSNGKVVSLSMQCTMREDPKYKLSSEDIYLMGYERGSNG
jgi:hypothetical protein